MEKKYDGQGFQNQQVQESSMIYVKSLLGHLWQSFLVCLYIEGFYVFPLGMGPEFTKKFSSSFHQNKLFCNYSIKQLSLSSGAL